MRHIVIDLEMNGIKPGSEGYNNICTRETIEIGAVMLDDNLQEISSFRTYVKPEYNETVNPKITRLTGITDNMLWGAPKFNEAFQMFANWCANSGDEFIVYAWSGADYNQVSKEIVLKKYELNDVEKELMKEPWKDFQREFDVQLGFERQLSLKTALEMAGIEYSGKEHDALDDARNTAELLQVFKDEELFNATLRKIEECMKPSSEGFSLGSLIDFSKINIE